MKTQMILVLLLGSLTAKGQFFAGPDVAVFGSADETSAPGPFYIGLGGTAGYESELWSVQLHVGGYIPRLFDTIYGYDDPIIGSYLLLPGNVSKSAMEIGMASKYFLFSSWFSEFRPYSIGGMGMIWERNAQRYDPVTAPEIYERYWTKGYFFRFGLGANIYVNDAASAYVEILGTANTSFEFYGYYYNDFTDVIGLLLKFGLRFYAD